MTDTYLNGRASRQSAHRAGGGCLGSDSPPAVQLTHYCLKHELAVTFDGRLETVILLALHYELCVQTWAAGRLLRVTAS